MKFNLFSRAAALSSLIVAVMLHPAVAATPENGGPWDAHFMSGGIGIERQLPASAGVLAPGAAWSVSGWIRTDEAQAGVVPVFVLGGDAGQGQRMLSLDDGSPALHGTTNALVADAAIRPGTWTHIAAAGDGREAVLYVNGEAVARGPLVSERVSPRIGVAPVVTGLRHLSATVVGLTLEDAYIAITQVRQRAAARPDFDIAHIWRVGEGWEWQKTANTGYWRPQDPWTLPQSKAPFSRPVVRATGHPAALESLGPDHWRINGWKMAAAPDIAADGAALSRGEEPAGQWYTATVPGTVLTTLVDQGVYPDPYHGLDNMAIPERLARQDYWYRTQFTVTAPLGARRSTLVFNGINYAAEVWFNGMRIGQTKGAFVRGQFEVALRKGVNTIAVRVSPPPHPGIPHEQSVLAGTGANGGQLTIDGPTFSDTEGWDWIPGIRDRDTGLWLPVELSEHGDVRILDPQVITELPNLPRLDVANVTVGVPVRNLGAGPRAVAVEISFDAVKVRRALTLPPGDTTVTFSPAEFAALRVHEPRLWWPNGYGEPHLQTLRVEVRSGAALLDHQESRFGLREVSYDLSLFDSQGHLRRVNVRPTVGKLAGQKLIDVRHEAIKESPRGFAESLTAEGEHSAGVTDIAETLPEPHLALRVNGVRIAARGGNWGMDDAMKRSGRERLEPYFRLHREAHLNIIRNWMGTNTEPQFYDLADEYGLMVLNDFWQSTQDYQVEPQDPRLFLDNMRDAVARYRNHPCIVAWFGRNEGVPYPMLNTGMDDLIAELDGTRWFTGSSNRVNLQGSGPYSYRPPAGYFTDLATGFSVESGTSSLSTLESLQAVVPPADRWPLGDTFAYHDWHFDGNGDTHPFMAALDQMYGAGAGLEDFERKAQMMNTETYKAFYEGFLGHLWTRNSGRLMWMSHPAWPSNSWQLYSWDYDTSAAYFGAKAANAPVHVQLNLPGNELVVVNTTQQDRTALVATSTVVTLDNKVLLSRVDRLDALANRATALPALPLVALMEQRGMVLVRLRLADAGGEVVDENFYWRGRDAAAYRSLGAMPEANLDMTATAPTAVDGEQQIAVTLRNASATPSLNAKLTLLDSSDNRILPAYYSDNYVALLPGESRVITIRIPAGRQAGAVALRGWNLKPARIAIEPR